MMFDFNTDNCNALALALYLQALAELNGNKHRDND